MAEHTVDPMGDPAGGPRPEHTMPLLALITQRSLDADYEHVAARKRASGDQAPRHPLPRRTAAVVLLVFGLLVTVAAVQTSRNASVDSASRTDLIDQVIARRTSLADLQRDLSRKESRVLNLRSRLTTLATSEQAARSRVARLQERSGFGAVRGPGIQATLGNAPDAAGPELIRDSDLALLTDALWAAGAEAISVNGERLTVLSAFRNVGVGVLVNSQPLTPPYVFSVVGDPDTLPADLLSSSIGGQWYALKDSLGLRFEVKDGGTMTLPAAHQQPLRHAGVVPPSAGKPGTQTGEGGT